MILCNFVQRARLPALNLRVRSKQLHQFLLLDERNLTRALGTYVLRCLYQPSGRIALNYPLFPLDGEDSFLEDNRVPVPTLSDLKQLLGNGSLLGLLAKSIYLFSRRMCRAWIRHQAEMRILRDSLVAYDSLPTEDSDEVLSATSSTLKTVLRMTCFIFRWAHLCAKISSTLLRFQTPITSVLFYRLTTVQ